MVGPGTGIAPFRSFLLAPQGDRRQGPRLAVLRPSARGEDFFYRDELDGLLGRRYADAAVDGLVARRRRKGLRTGPHAAGRPRAVELAAGRRAFLRLRRRQAHGQGRGGALLAEISAKAGQMSEAAARDFIAELKDDGPLPGGRLLMTLDETSPSPGTSRGRPPRVSRSAPPAPTAASAAACWPRPTARAAQASTAIPSTPPTSAGCARRVRRSARRWGSRRGCCTHIGRRSADELGPRARSGRTRDCSASRAAHGPRGDRVLPLGPAADRGLLRRQQAGEGLHRHAACRHQLAAVHGLLGRRPSPRVRRRRGAAMLRRPGAGRPRGAGGLQRRVVPPDPLPAHPDRARPSAACASSTSIRAAPRPARVSTCSCRSGPAPTPRLWSGLLVWLAEHRAIDTEFIDAHTQGFFAALWGARALAPASAAVADATGLDARDIERFYDWFAATPRVVSCYSQGVNQSAQGTDKVNAIINCHLATGRIGKPGSGPLSLTGQPNAMGGREVGGLANMLAAHMGFSSRRARSRPPLLGRAEPRGRRRPQGRRHVRGGRRRTHQGAVGDGHQPGRVAAARRRSARGAAPARAAGRLRECRVQRHRERCAHVPCPRRRGARRTARSPTRSGASRASARSCRFPGDARPDWWMLSQVARRLGLRRGLRLSLGRRDLRRACAPVGLRERRQRASSTFPAVAGLARRSVRRVDAVSMAVARAGERDDRAPVRRRPLLHRRTARPASWPSPSRASSAAVSTDVAVRAQHRPRARPVAHHDAHGARPRASRAHIAEPFVEIHPDDAARWVSCRARWRALRPRYGAAVAARAGQSEGSSGARCSCRSTGRPRTAPAGASARWCSRRPIRTPASPRPRRRRRASPRSPSATTAWPCRASRSSARASPIGRAARATFGHVLHFALDAPGGGLAALAARDAARGRHRHLRRCRGRLLSRGRAARRTARGHDLRRPDAYAAPRPSGSSRSSSARSIPATERRALLAGRPVEGATEEGPIVCVCFQVGAARIAAAAAEGCRTVEKIGARLGAGTNCGSCVPEIRRLIAAEEPVAEPKSQPEAAHEPA